MNKREKHRGRPSAHPAPRAAEKPTHWGEVAEWYDKLVGDEGSEFHQQVILPGVLRMLGGAEKCRGLTVLDLACGQGVLSRKLAQAGCTVIGLDAAAPLIDAARKRNESERVSIRYEVADATKLLRDDGTLMVDVGAGVNAVLIVLAIQNITPLSPVWQACQRALKTGGHLIVVMMHPAFRVPKASDWGWKDAGSGGVGEQGRVVYQYLSSSKIEIQTHPGKAAHGKGSPTTPHFHRPLQAYVNTMGNAGLLIDHVEEWASHKTSEAGPKKAALDRARKEIPMFLALRARKVVSG
jgi:ubiquinone/menaquinone biosynthesis C-methylase UbiE